MIEKNNKHIESKERAEEIQEDLNKLFVVSRNVLLARTFNQLEKYNDKSFEKWNEIQLAQMQAFFKNIEQTVSEERKRAIKRTNNAYKDYILTPEQEKAMTKIVRESYQDLLNGTLNTYKKALNEVMLNSNVKTIGAPQVLSEAVTQAIKHNTDYGIVVYNNGRNVKWENYIDMKVRTEISRDITENMVNEGKSLGAVFYIASYYGDCADDHVEGNGAIFYEEAYASMIEDEEVLKQVQDYIKENKLLSVQEAIVNNDRCPYFTTRPNCRHYLQFIDIEDVINFKSKSDVEKYRKDHDLQYKGKYKPEKYQMLKEQRYNERQVRKFRERSEVLKERLDKLPSSASQDERKALELEITTANSLTRKWQKIQTKHTNEMRKWDYRTVEKDGVKEKQFVKIKELDRQKPGRIIYDFKNKKKK